MNILSKLWNGFPEISIESSQSYFPYSAITYFIHLGKLWYYISRDDCEMYNES